MALWPAQRITLTQAQNPAPDASGGNDGAAGIVMKGQEHLGIRIEVPETHTHSVILSLDEEPASAHHRPFRLNPGDALNTTALRSEQQPTGTITAWTDPSLTVAGPPVPGDIVLEFLIIRPS